MTTRKAPTHPAAARRSLGAILAGALLSGAILFPAPASADPMYEPPPPTDRDGDGLFSDAEARAGTNPDLADTDGDFLSDYDEVITFGTNPVKKDTDDDGVPDKEELRAQTDPKTKPASPAPNPFRAEVLDDVDVYDVPGGDGNVIDILRKGSNVFPRTPCPAADWCELTTSPPGQSVGWVWGAFLRNK